MQSDSPQQAVTLQPVAAGPVRAGRLSLRLRGAALFLPAAGILATAAWLTPRRAGHGTHQQLGLPPCSFLARTGWPCPSCGMTTSFAAMAHGRPDRAFLAHPLGVVLFLGTAAVGLCGLGELATGRAMLPLLRPGAWWAVVVGVGLLGGWAFKILYGLATGALPAR